VVFKGAEKFGGNLLALDSVQKMAQTFINVFCNITIGIDVFHFVQTGSLNFPFRINFLMKTPEPRTSI
jgi:hypothetical protein